MLILVFGTGVAIAGCLSHQFLERSARKQVPRTSALDDGCGRWNAHVHLEAGGAARRPTSTIIRFADKFIPAYSATGFSYLRSTYPDYSYKEASLNPTNLRNRAVDWENDVIQIFRNHPDMKEFSSERGTPGGRMLFLAKPLTVDMPCLQCHSTPEQAPAAMIKVYGADHGFGWNVGEPIAAQIVSVPMTVPLTLANQAFKTLIVSLGAISLITLFLLDLAIIMVVIRPVTRLARTADLISNGDLNVPEIPVKGSDEIADLARSFNRMYLSLVKAIRMLES
jgi:protein-histidine pros-kinase